jgi:hypothetical protein
MRLFERLAASRYRFFRLLQYPFDNPSGYCRGKIYRPFPQLRLSYAVHLPDGL